MAPTGLSARGLKALSTRTNRNAQSVRTRSARAARSMASAMSRLMPYLRAYLDTTRSRASAARASAIARLAACAARASTPRVGGKAISATMAASTSHARRLTRSFSRGGGRRDRRVRLRAGRRAKGLDFGMVDWMLESNAFPSPGHLPHAREASILAIRRFSAERDAWEEETRFPPIIAASHPPPAHLESIVSPFRSAETPLSFP